MLFFLRTNEVTRQKERETNSTIKDYDRNLLTPTNSSFNLGSYFSGIELQPGIYSFYILLTVTHDFNGDSFIYRYTAYIMTIFMDATDPVIT